MTVVVGAVMNMWVDGFYMAVSRLIFTGPFALVYVIVRKIATSPRRRRRGQKKTIIAPMD